MTLFGEYLDYLIECNIDPSDFLFLKEKAVLGDYYKVVNAGFAMTIFLDKGSNNLLFIYILFTGEDFFGFKWPYRRSEMIYESCQNSVGSYYYVNVGVGLSSSWDLSGELI